MTPDFAAAVDPVFMHVLDLLERIERGEDPSVDNERRRIELLISEAEAKLGQREDWRLAKYGLASWIDEMLILDAPWPGSGKQYWNEHKLETGFFNTTIRATQFYVEAGKASALPNKDALEVFYVGALLGFQGLYRSENPGAQIAQLADAYHLRLPPDLQTWIGQTARSIRVGQGREPIADSTRPPEKAPPMEGAFALMWPSLVAVILGAICIAWVLIAIFGERWQ